jgi:hypothetical protein
MGLKGTYIALLSHSSAWIGNRAARGLKREISPKNGVANPDGGCILITLRQIRNIVLLRECTANGPVGPGPQRYREASQ